MKSPAQKCLRKVLNDGLWHPDRGFIYRFSPTAGPCRRLSVHGHTVL